jgi:outer membrane immunogenic protein
VAPRDHFGWVAGVGGEVRLGATNWIGRIEYLHYDFGTVEAATTVVTNPGTGFADRAGRQTIDVVRGGISYKFAATP